MLIPFAETDADMQMRVRAFRQELQKLGWTEGGNVQLDERWTSDDMDQVGLPGLIDQRPQASIEEHWVLVVYGNSHYHAPAVKCLPLPGCGPVA